ncbi:MAG: hypothetical protein AB7S53_06620 [Thiomonas sp.]
MKSTTTTLKLVPLFFAIAALSACHQGGVGVDSGASQKAATGSENGLASQRGIQQRTAASAAVQMPASGLVVDAISAWGKSQLPVDPTTQDRLWSMQMQTPHSGSLPADADALCKMHEAIASALAHLPPDKAAKVRHVQPRCEHEAAAQFIGIAAQPLQGWPVGGLGAKGQAEMAKWARWSAQDVTFSNLILSQIAATPVLRDALADPAAAHAAITAAFLAIPAQQIEAAWAQAAAGADGSLQLDMTGSGPAPVHFVIGSGDFQAGPEGWKWSQSGVPWFGQGRINGKVVMLGLDSAIDKSQSQTSGTGTTTGTGTEQGAGGSAGVK